MTLPVVDYSWSRPNLAQLASAACGVMRYTSNAPSGKEITRPEADQLNAAGWAVGITWEATEDGMLGGALAGRPAAASSLAMTRAAGLPDGVTYYAADRDFTLGGRPTSVKALDNMYRLADFCAGAASVSSWDDVGVYGGYYVLEWLFANTPLQHGWQTVAWSYDAKAVLQVHPRACMLQHVFDVPVAGAQVDLNVVLGDWRPRTGNVHHTTNGDLSMADAASLHQDVANFATLTAARFDRIDAMQQFIIKAEGARFDALASALQTLHTGLTAAQAGQAVDFAAMAKILDGAQVTLAAITPPAPTAVTEGASA